jgi:hypothetical protein
VRFAGRWMARAAVPVVRRVVEDQEVPLTISRLRHDPTTRAYATRRTAEGKSAREIKRCLKRYLARHLFRLLDANPNLHPNLPATAP